jgi:hypothetical protein
MDHVRYIDKTREYYAGAGYDKPYRWAHFDGIPFTPLTNRGAFSARRSCRSRAS